MSLKTSGLHLNNLKKFWWLYFPLLIFGIQIVFIFFYQSSSPFKDEIFFINASERFKHLSFDNILLLAKDYPLPQPPLIYMIGGLAFNFAKPLLIMRIFNCILATTTSILLFRLLDQYRSKLSLIYLTVPFLWIFNPYFQLISLYFYTDAFYIFLVMIIIWGNDLNQSWLKYIGCFFAPLIRQFGIIYAIGGIFSELIRENKITKTTIYYALSLSGLTMLIIYWGGLAPSLEISQKIARIRHEHGPVFFSYLFYYLSAMTFWLFPIIVFQITRINRSRKIVISFLTVFVLTLIFYPNKNFYHGIEQLGLYHTLLKYLPLLLAKLIMAFFAGLGFIYLLDLFKNVQIKTVYKLWIVLFFTLQSINPLCWDKYILELILIVFLANITKRIPD